MQSIFSFFREESGCFVNYYKTTECNEKIAGQSTGFGGLETHVQYTKGCKFSQQVLLDLF